MSSSSGAGPGAVGGGSGMDFVRSTIEVAERAVAFESQQNFQAAIYFYQEARHLLDRAIQEDASPSGSLGQQLEAKSNEYLLRIQQLTAGCCSDFILDDNMHKILNESHWNFF